MEHKMNYQREFIDTYSLDFSDDEQMLAESIVLDAPKGAMRIFNKAERKILKSLLVKALISDLMIGLPYKECIDEATITFTKIFGEPEARLDFQENERGMHYINVHSLVSQIHSQIPFEELAEALAKYLGRTIQKTEIGLVISPN